MSKRKVLVGLLGAFIIAVFISVGYISQQYTVPILMYHSVRPDQSINNRLAVSPEAFERQMGFLKKNNYTVLSLEKLADLIRDKIKIPPKTVVLTFDDGYKDNYTYAFPIIKKYGFPVTIFLIVDDIGAGNMLSWEEVKAMQASGLVVFGSHTLEGGALTKITSEDELRRQIFDSKKILEEKLGRKVNAFSYPIGAFNDKIKELVKDAGYGLAVITTPRSRAPSDDYFALKRLRISENAKNYFVFWVETSGYYNFMREHRSKKP